MSAEIDIDLNKPLSSKDIYELRNECDYTWHECEDTYSAQLVPSKIHGKINHYGGVGIVNQMAEKQQKYRIKAMQDFLGSRGIKYKIVYQQKGGIYEVCV